MSLKSVLIALIVAGVLAGLVLVSRGVSGLGGGEAEGAMVRSIGIDPVSIVEVRIEGSKIGMQSARREAGTVDSWMVELGGLGGGEGSEVWEADATRVRTVLRALGSAAVSVTDEEDIEKVYGTLSLVQHDQMTTEVRFGTEVSGGFVRVEIVWRGGDGIATNRWFGRVERSLRDTLLNDGLASWRSKDLFGMTLGEIVGAEVSSGGHTTTLSRGSRGSGGIGGVGGVGGWGLVHPWAMAADRDAVEELLGLTLGLRAERFYDGAVYTDDLTGLDRPIARIEVSTADVFGETPGGKKKTIIEIGTALDSSGEEVFARYTVEGRGVSILAVKTKGLSRLTSSPLAYVHQTASVMSRPDIGVLRILDLDGAERFVCRPRLDSWAVDDAAVSPSQGAAIDRLVKVLTQEQAERIYELKEMEAADATLIGRIELESRNGESALFEVSIESRDGGVRLHVWRGLGGVGGLGDEMGLVWVLGSAEAGGTGAWVAALVAGELRD